MAIISCKSARRWRGGFEIHVAIHKVSNCRGMSCIRFGETCGYTHFIGMAPVKCVLQFTGLRFCTSAVAPMAIMIHRRCFWKTILISLRFFQSADKYRSFFVNLDIFDDMSIIRCKNAWRRRGFRNS